MKLAGFTYDAALDVVLVDLAGVRLETRADIDRHWERTVDWWKKGRKGEKAIYVVRYDGFALNLRESDYYASRMQEALQVIAHTVIRYGGDPLQRSAARTRGVKIHMPSHLYTSLDEALDMVARIRSTMGETPIPPLKADRGT
jgi:hypothetical protein